MALTRIAILHTILSGERTSCGATVTGRAHSHADGPLRSSRAMSLPAAAHPIETPSHHPREGAKGIGLWRDVTDIRCVPRDEATGVRLTSTHPTELEWGVGTDTAQNVSEARTCARPFDCGL
eukprot:6193216-Pleurochrysis_carterae.AAC.1